MFTGLPGFSPAPPKMMLFGFYSPSFSWICLLRGHIDTFHQVLEHIYNFFSALRLILGCLRVSDSCLSLFTCFLHLLISRAAFLFPPLPAPLNLDPTLSSHNTGRLTPLFFQYFQLLMTFLHHATLVSSPPAVCYVSVRLYHCIFLTISSFPPRKLRGSPTSYCPDASHGVAFPCRHKCAAILSLYQQDR